MRSVLHALEPVAFDLYRAIHKGIRTELFAVTGAADPVRLCSEWITLADPSGKPHHLTKDIAVRRGPDGQYYVDPGVRSDFRLLALALFVGVVLAIGMWIRRYLVKRYRLQLDPAASRSASGLR